MVESWDSNKRVAIIGTGHLSLELGGPRQFGEHGPDPEFDRKAVEWIASGDIEGCLAEVTLDSLHLPGNATHGFMDFMLMMGAAGEGAKADHVDTLDLFHTMEAYFTWYPNGGRDRDEQVPARQVPLHRRPRPRTGRALPRRPRRHGAWWEAERAKLLNCTDAEQTTWLAFTDDEREALREHDHVTLFEMGAHPFLTLTLFIAMFERDHGPLEYQKAYAERMKHIRMPYPDITT